MSHHNAYCMGNYDFEKIALYAHERFFKGKNILEQLSQSSSHRERQEIGLVSSLSTRDSVVQKLNLDCPYKEQCKVTNCHTRIKSLIESQLPSATQ